MVRFDLMYTDNSVLFEFNLPKGKHSTLKVLTSDVGGIGRAYVYSYNNGSTFYISNDISLCPEYLGKEEQLLIGKAFLLDSLSSVSFLDIDGYDPKSGYYRDWQSRYICIGYYGVSSSNKALFDKAIVSLRVRRKYLKESIITPQSVSIVSRL